MLARTLVLPLVLAAPAAAQIVFAPPSPNPVSHPSSGVLAGDVDVDGHLDLIALPPQPGPFEASFFTTFLGDGEGLFAKTPSHLLAGTAAGEGQIVDLVGPGGSGAPDGLPDLLVGAVPGTPNNGVGWFGGLGDGLFGGGSGISLTPSIIDVIATDIDGDGDVDLSALSLGSLPFLPSSLTALLKTPSSYTIKGAVSLTAGARYLALTDWDDDGKLEAACSGGGAFTLLGEDPTGGFTAPVTIPLGGNPQELQAADLTFDGIEDLVVANAVMGAVQVLPGETDGSPGAPQVNVVGGSPSRLVLGDLDGDGFVDALASSGLHGDVLVLRGAGDGTLTRVATVSGETIALGLVLGDADDDGDLDAGVARGGTPGNLDVLINATYPAGSPFADLGHALPGVFGYPILIADGSLLAGQPFAFDLRNVKPLAQSFAFVGLSAAYLPYKGGTLVPNPDLIVFGLATDPLGDLHLAGSWPPGASGVTFYLQFWTYDEAGVKGKSASNALQAQIP